MTDERKECVQYIVAIITLFSGILMCYLSFIFNAYEIHDSALWYFGETATLAGALMGITQYVNTSVRKAEMRMSHHVDKRIREEEERYHKEEKEPEYLDPPDMKDI